MRKLMDFIYYNIFVYVIYGLIDYLFDALNFYSNHELGKDLMVMPTSADMTLIGVNIITSMILGLIVLRYVQGLREV